MRGSSSDLGIDSALATDLRAIRSNIEACDPLRLYGRAILARDADATADLVRCWRLAYPGDRRADVRADVAMDKEIKNTV